MLIPLFPFWYNKKVNSNYNNIKEKIQKHSKSLLLLFFLYSNYQEEFNLKLIKVIKITNSFYLILLLKYNFNKN
jgi:hypothetical protein